MKLDLNLLKRLLVINHPTKQEWPMLSAIINECYKIDNLEFSMDSYANIFITKNTTNPEYYPCIVAHTDCVRSHTNKTVKIKHGKIFGKNPVNGKQIGLGLDDTVGICVALQMLREIPNIKACFTTEEEIGFLGADAAADNIDFFCDVSYFVQADRRGKSDLITYTNGIYSASELWLQEITLTMSKYGYSEEVGIGTDIGVLAERLQLSSVNISCGYYREHTDSEYGVISEIENCLNFIEDIIKTVPIDKQYEIKVDYYAYNSKWFGSRWPYEPDYSSNPSKTIYDYPKEYDNYIPCDDCMDYDCMHCPHGEWWNGSYAKTKDMS